MTDPLHAYYAARACEYESVYAKSERQADLARIRDEWIPETFKGRSRVLDVACGTGYWTPIVARHAGAVLGIDIGEDVLDVARSKVPVPTEAGATMAFSIADAMVLRRSLGEFDGAFVGFFWSHVSKADLGRFLHSLHSRLTPAAGVLILDNRFVPGSSSPISRLDPTTGDTYQVRHLQNGTTHEILKNFPTEAELREALGGSRVTGVEVLVLEYFWGLRYQLER